MLAISDSDYVPLPQFSLLWRFADSRWNQLTEAELALIRPLSLSASNHVDRAIQSLLGEPAAPFPPDVFNNVVQCNTSGNPQEGRTWLESVLPSIQGQVAVSWDTNIAVVTTLQLFIKYWDDFCYPSSDDTTIVPFDLSWIIQYYHWQTLFFAARVTS